MRPFGAIVFDVDSTLVDSRDHILNYCRDMFAYVGKPFPEDRRELFYTLDKDSLDRAMFDAAELTAANDFRRKDPYLNRLPEITALTGADLLLGRLAERRLRLGILTNRGSSTMPLLKQLGWDSYFAPVLSADLLSAPKPDPEGMHQIASAWQLPCRDILFVGDSALDAECAARAGCAFVQVTAVSPPLVGHTSFTDLRRLADWLVAGTAAAAARG